MNIKGVSKAIGGLIGALVPIVAALISYNVISGQTAITVSGILIASVPLLTFLGVYKAPPNTPKTVTANPTFTTDEPIFDDNAH